MERKINYPQQPINDKRNDKDCCQKRFKIRNQKAKNQSQPANCSWYYFKNPIDYPLFFILQIRSPRNFQIIILHVPKFQIFCVFPLTNTTIRSPINRI